MRTIDRAGIEKRAQIAAAKATDRTLTYTQLRARFGAGPRVIADALKREASEWEAMLGTAPGVAAQRWEYQVVKVLRQQLGDGKPATVKEKGEGESRWRDVAGGKVQTVLGEHGAAGWELVSSMLAGQDEGKGAWLYELHFKRRAGKP